MIFNTAKAGSLVILIVSPSASYAWAEGADYDCKVTSVVGQQFPITGGSSVSDAGNYYSDGSGSFVSDWFKSSGQLRKDAIARVYVGKTFRIDRVTGELSGEISSRGWRATRVISPGNDQWSFRSTVEAFPGPEGSSQQMYIEVSEFANSDMKPFVGLGLSLGSDVLLGTCIHVR